jgi:hypothetical protein
MNRSSGKDVMGLAFAVAGYSSFRLIVAMSGAFGLGRHQLHRHLRALSGRGRCVTPAFIIVRNHRYRRRFPPNSGQHRDRVDQCPIRVPVRWSAASGNLGGRCYSRDRCVELFRSKAYRRIGCCGLRPDCNHSCSPRVFFLTASRRLRNFKSPLREALGLTLTIKPKYEPVFSPFEVQITDGRKTKVP